jgi:hypothetical protein
MSQGQIDHPSYITRQQLAYPTTVGASKTTIVMSPAASNVRIRKCQVTVQIAGTGAYTMALVAVGTGTTFTSTSSATFTTTSTIGTATLSTSAQGTVFALSTDANLTINQGGYIAAIGGTEATGQCMISLEAYVDPLSAWTGN